MILKLNKGTQYLVLNTYAKNQFSIKSDNRSSRSFSTVIIAAQRYILSRWTAETSPSSRPAELPS